MTVELHITAVDPGDLLAQLRAITGDDAPPRRTRAPKADGVGTSGPAVPPAGSAELPAGMSQPQAQADDMFGDAKPPAAQTAAPPKQMTLDEFLAAVKALLGKGKDDAIRNKVAEMGFSRVRDVPPDKFATVLDTVQKL